MKNYRILIFYFVFFFIPKIKVWSDVYIWPFEIFMVLFIFYFIITRKNIIIEQTLIFPVIFFYYLLVITGIHIIFQDYDFLITDILRNVKELLYFVFYIFTFSYLYKRYYHYNTYLIINHILKIFIFFSTAIMIVMLSQIFYHFLFYGIPSISELIWNYSSNQRPYLYTGRYITLPNIFDIHDIKKGNHNSTGILSVLTFFISMYLYKKSKSKLLIISMLVSIITLFLSFSRSSFIVFFLLLIFYFLFLQRSIKTKIKFLFCLLFSIVALIYLARDYIKYTIFSKIFLTIDSISSGQVEASLNTRINIWKKFFSGDFNYYEMLLGSGFGEQGIRYFTNGQYNQLESLFLNMIGWGGIFSAIFFLFYFNLITKSGKLKFVDNDLAAIIKLFFIIFLLPNIFSGGDLIMDSTLHYLFPIIFLILYHSRKRKHEYFIHNS